MKGRGHERNIFFFEEYPKEKQRGEEREPFVAGGPRPVETVNGAPA